MHHVGKAQNLLTSKQVLKVATSVPYRITVTSYFLSKMRDIYFVCMIRPLNQMFPVLLVYCFLISVLPYSIYSRSPI